MPDINLIHGDCIEFLKTYKVNQFDLAIVDPPYGIGADTHEGKAENGWTQYKSNGWDNGIPKIEYWNELFRVSKNQIVWGGNYMTEYLRPSMGWIFWDKGQRDFSLADGELAWTSFNRALRVFEMPRGKALAKNNLTGGRAHPTQKPVDLYRWVLDKYANKGDNILDTHLGSGTIALACHEMEYDLTGIEIDIDYYNMAVKKYNKYTKQLKLF